MNPPLPPVVRRCFVCGAKIPKGRAPATTCDATCMRAQRKHISREAQTRSEMEQQARHEQEQQKLGYKFQLKYI
jgi:predicted nucleic acid-binding Zn ribbon protein